MSPRSLFAMLIAVALLFAPFAMRSGSATAMAADHPAEMMEAGHCGDQPATGEDGKSGDESCCVAMCTAIAIAPLTPAEPRVLASSGARPSLARFHHGFLAELPTPPPRLA